MNLTATVIEVAPQDGYAIVRFQLAGTDGSATTGDSRWRLLMHLCMKLGIRINSKLDKLKADNDGN